MIQSKRRLVCLRGSVGKGEMDSIYQKHGVYVVEIYTIRSINSKHDHQHSTNVRPYYHKKNLGCDAGK